MGQEEGSSGAGRREGVGQVGGKGRGRYIHTYICNAAGRVCTYVCTVCRDLDCVAECSIHCGHLRTLCEPETHSKHFLPDLFLTTCFGSCQLFY